MSNETPNQKFKRVANPRLKTIIKYTRLVTKMVKSPAYAWDDKDKEKILTAIESEISNLVNAFDSKNETKDIEDVL